MNQLRLIHYHVSNIENIYIEKSSFLINETELLTSATKELREYISSNNAEQMEEYEKKLKHLLDLCWKKSNPSSTTSTSSLPHELIFLYEIGRASCRERIF